MGARPGSEFLATVILIRDIVAANDIAYFS